jgi:hypothetical protein
MHEYTFETFLAFCLFSVCLVVFLKWRFGISFKNVVRWLLRSDGRRWRGLGREMTERSRLLGGEIRRFYV